MSETKMVTFLAPVEEISAWDSTVRRSPHRNRTSWIRAVLNAAASGIPADKLVPQLIVQTQAEAVAEELKERAIEVASNPQGPCERRLPKGTYCKRCGRTHA